MDNQSPRCKAPNSIPQSLHPYHCIHIILGVNRFNQWTEHISSTELASTFGMVETIEDMLIAHRLRWLGHLARMGPERSPKQLLFGEFEKTRPQHGTRKRWRDCIVADLKATKITEWYQLAQDRETWKSKCREGIAMRKRPAEQCTSFSCPCGRSFRRQGDLTRHRRFCNFLPATDD